MYTVFHFSGSHHYAGISSHLWTIINKVLIAHVKCMDMYTLTATQYDCTYAHSCAKCAVLYIEKALVCLIFKMFIFLSSYFMIHLYVYMYVCVHVYKYVCDCMLF